MDRPEIVPQLTISLGHFVNRVHLGKLKLEVTKLLFMVRVLMCLTELGLAVFPNTVPIKAAHLEVTPRAERLAARLQDTDDRFSVNVVGFFVSFEIAFLRESFGTSRVAASKGPNSQMATLMCLIRCQRLVLSAPGWSCLLLDCPSA
jgi:hypothetical protein